MSEQQSSANVETNIRQHYGAQLDACERLAHFATGLFQSWAGRGIESTADGLVVALLARSLDTFTCAIRLAAGGYGAQASMLNRSLFEDMVDAHWVVADPPTAEERYEQHDAHGRMLLADAIRKYPDVYALTDLPVFDAGDRERLDRIFGKFGSRSWSGLGLHARVALIENQWIHEADRRRLWFMVDLAHRENNQALHVSAASLNAAVQKMEGEGVAFNIGPRPDPVERVVFGSFWTFVQTLSLVLDRFGVPVEDAERVRLFSARDFYVAKADDVRAVGRNDPCPCGSGAKFKRCHGA